MNKGFPFTDKLIVMCKENYHLLNCKIQGVHGGNEHDYQLEYLYSSTT